MKEAKNKIILITGSTDGIGRQTAIDCAGMGARVIVHGRDRARAESARDEIKRATGSAAVDICVADLSSRKQIRALSRDINSRYPRLDVLINNAGVYQKTLVLSGDGFEMTFAVNYLAPYMLSLMLLEPLAKAASPRIVNVASQAHAKTIDFGNLNGEKEFDPYAAYAQSKLCEILFTFELAERLAGTGITVNCLHPGVISTKLLHASFSGGGPVTEGSKALVHCALSPALNDITGKFFDSGTEARPAEMAYDNVARLKLWTVTENMTEIIWEEARNALFPSF